jgi:methionyl-tRNA synthetase
MLEYSGFRKPTKIYAHGFLTVNGEKMSKSRGTFINAESYLKLSLNPEWLRYYYAAKLNGTMEDIDLNFDDFLLRVNSDMVGKYVNIASRCAGFIGKYFDGKLAKPDFSAEIEKNFAAASAEIAGYYEQRDYGKAMRKIMQLADLANQYVDANKPWEIAKSDNKRAELHSVCSTALALFRELTLYLKPVLPQLAGNVESLLGIPPLSWNSAWKHLQAGHKIKPYEHLMTRIDPKQIEALIAANKETPAMNTATTQPATDTISIDDFSKVDLRIAKIVNAEGVEGADKLLKLTLDVGALGTRQVFAGIKSAYDPAKLIGRLTVMVANLAPRKMKFGLSEGMVLAASDPNGETTGLFLLSPDSGAEPGLKVK